MRPWEEERHDLEHLMRTATSDELGGEVVADGVIDELNAQCRVVMT